MNILPKKSWHVRTKRNIARVRADEAKAAAEEKETQRRIALAAQEARTALLRERGGRRLAEVSATLGSDETESIDTSQSEKLLAIDGKEGSSGEAVDLRFGLPLGSLKDVVQPDGHVNFFQDIQSLKSTGGTNEEYEKEKREEQEDYEKKIGYLVYLGQDSIEHSKKAPWYSKKIDRGKGDDFEKELLLQKDLDEAVLKPGGLEQKSKSVSAEDLKQSKFKSFLDPLKDVRRYLKPSGVKSKPKSMPPASIVPLPDDKISRVDHSNLEAEEKRGLKRKHKHKSSKKSHKKEKKRRKHSSKRSRHRGESSSNSSSEESDRDKEKQKVLEKLRFERLQRERSERKRAEQALAAARGVQLPEENLGLDAKKHRESDYSAGTSTSSSAQSRVRQKYNSQFNPHLARQNFDE